MPCLGRAIVADLPRLAILGIGHPLRRDDAAGMEVCERLRPALGARNDTLIVNGGPAPENCVGQLRAFAPDRVVVIDAARMGRPPGTLRRIDPSDSDGWGASSHTLPLPMFCRYLEQTLGCDVTLLGIEPADTSFGEGLSPAVSEAVAHAVAEALVGLAERTAGSNDCGPPLAEQLVVLRARKDLEGRVEERMP